MAGHHHWDNIKRPLPPEHQAELERRAQAADEGATLAELRALSGKALVGADAALALIVEEEGEEVQLSTLRLYLGALGFDLELIARPRHDHEERAVPLKLGGA